MRLTACQPPRRTVLTLRDGQITQLRGHIHREEALADAGIEGYRWR